jgi:beta-N-acetylhexosaminidase
MLLIALLLPSLPVHAQTPAPLATPALAELTAPDLLEAQVELLLNRMTPADRVGQLFVISFDGRDTSFESDIVELIHGYRIGGVVLSPAQGNFSNEKGVDTPREVATLANQLQAIAYGILLPAEQALDPIPFAPWPPRDYTFLPRLTGVTASNVPLFIGIEQAGDNLPGTALRRGFTPLPSQMALGATWDPGLVEQAGQIIGQELAAVGVNLLLGPTLDLFDQPRTDPVGRLALDSFGGDPYWVSRMSSAYISGIHIGSENQIAAISRHFPGQGNVDRFPDQEVATIQKSLEEMQQSALRPFGAVTRNPSSIISEGGDPAVTDGMMTSHMRFSGLQGSAAGRNTPISLAPELRTILEQQGFTAWQEAGGILMSGALGVPAVRQIYDTVAPDLFYRRVTLDAFSAGNDLLYLTAFSDDGSWTSAKANIKETIGFFQDRYNNDDDFAAQVDAAVRRILRLKLGLNRDSLRVVSAGNSPLLENAPLEPLIPLTEVLTSASALLVLTGESRAAAESVMATVARNAMTILYPDPATLTEPLPPAFRTDDNLLIISDSRLLQECSKCTAEAAVGPDELANIIRRLYGSEATGQIDAERVVSLTFADLIRFLDDRAGVAALAAGAALTPTTSLTLGVPAPATPVIDGDSAAGDDTPSSEVRPDAIARTTRQIEEADWIIFAMLDVDATTHPSSVAVKRFLSEYGDKLTDHRIIVFGLHAPFFLDATEMSRLTAFFGVYSKTQPFLESAVRALFRSFSPDGAPPVNVPGTRFSSLPARLQPNPATSVPVSLVAADGTLLIQSPQQPSDGQVTVPLGQIVRIIVGPVLDMNGNPVPDGVPIEYSIRVASESVTLDVEPDATRDGGATREIVLDRAGEVQILVTAGSQASSMLLRLTVLPPETPLTSSISGTMTSTVNTGQTGSQLLDNRLNGVTLLVALLTILLVLSLFLLVQVRLLPRQALVRNLLSGAVGGLCGYLLFGLDLFPGSPWLRDNLSYLATGVVTFVSTLAPLLWFQLRAESHR